VGGEQRGYDGGKKTKDHKRRILVETEGFVFKALPSTAPRRDGLWERIKTLLHRAQERFPRLRHL
jgi:putative transposase